MPALLHRRLPAAPLRRPAGAALPQAAAVLARWSADAITPQADNTALASWPDAVGGLAVTQATAAAQPKYRTGGAGGKPYVLFAGAQWLTTGNATNPVAQLLADPNAASTTMVVYRNPQTTDYGFVFSASTGSPWYALQANGVAAGMFANGVQQTGGAGTGLTTICYAKRTPDTSVGRAYVNNTCFGTSGAITPGTGQDVWIGGVGSIGGTLAKAEIYDVIVWNRALSAGEVMQAEKWARDKYVSPYPWAGAPFRVFHGDSITDGYTVSNGTQSYPARVAAANGWPLGRWTNLGHVGASMADLKTEAVADVDPMVALLGATPLWLTAWEWYNQRNLTTAAATAATASYFQARRAAGAAKLVMLSSTDAADPVDNVANRAAYNAWCDANALTYADVYIPVHKATAQGGASEIGPEGACPNASPYTPYFNTDGIHLLPAGLQVLGTLVAPAVA